MLPANSGAVHGARYNARVLAQHIARTRFGFQPERPHLSLDGAVSFLVSELDEAADLFHQRGYLARVLTTDPDGGFRDDRTRPLAAFLDAGGPNALAATLESDGSGAIYPVLYTRRAGRVAEHRLDVDPFLGSGSADGRRILGELAGEVAADPA